MHGEGKLNSLRGTSPGCTRSSTPICDPLKNALPVGVEKRGHAWSTSECSEKTGVSPFFARNMGSHMVIGAYWCLTPFSPSP